MVDLNKKKIISELKYVYSENNTLSIIFQNNDLLLGVAGEFNKSLEKNTINVLVENKIEKQNKLFGRNKYISPVIFDGNEDLIGKVVKVKVQTSNQNTLFGLIDKKKEAA